MSDVQYLITDPLRAQADALGILQSRLCDGKQIVDGNNVPSFLLETMSNWVADSMNSIGSINSSRHAYRAKSTKDLFQHMSQWDYVGLYYKPASTTLTIFFDKNYLIENAISFNQNYQKIIIPKEATFIVAGLSFGIYYPIEIRINKITKNFSVTYDNSEESPFHKLADNTLKFTEINNPGNELLAIDIPTYQFTKNQMTVPLTKGTGFKTTIDLIDNFYVIDAFHFKNNNWERLEQTLSEMNYDPLKPTVQIDVCLEKNQLEVSIPQVYFSSDTIGTQIKIIVYETKGKIDVDISAIASGDLEILLNNSIDIDMTYTEILNRIPMIQIIPAYSHITGGSNGYTFEELRDNVLYGRFSTGVALSKEQLNNLFDSDEISTTLHTDSLPDRVFIANSPIKDTEGKYMAGGCLRTYFNQTVVDNCSTIKQNEDGSITVLPATMYKINGQSCMPLIDTEVNQINKMSLSHKIELFNNDTYTFSPYHVRMSLNDDIPLATTYEFINPVIEEITFIEENVNISTQLSIMNGAIIHPLNETSGFVVRIGIQRSSDLIDKPLEDFRIVGYTKDVNTGEQFYMDGTFFIEQDNLLYYDFILTSDYDINKFNRIMITSFLRPSGEPVTGCRVDLEFALEVFLDVKAKDIIGTKPDDPEEFVTTVKQSLNLKLGRALNEVINTEVDVSFTPIRYKVYTENIYETYPIDDYAKNPDGSLKVDIVNNEAVTYKLHNAGDYRLDEYGHKVILHPENSLIYVGGERVVADGRKYCYYVDMFQFDNKVLYVSDIDIQLVGRQLAEDIDLYFNDVSRVQKQLLEDTFMYFEPIRTIGNGEFVTKNNAKITHPLAMDFDMVIYVDDTLLDNEDIINNLTTSIYDIAREQIATGTISMALIQDQILQTFDDQIKSIDILGINGSSNIQTIVNLDGDTKPILARSLAFRSDGTIYLKEEMNLNFSTYTKRIN
ncbi:MAG: hypothetical protein GY804_08670 [Alphaproteobacteria bacterium]|nr:hypothetical protein [Alphaproteobacteria bacterium]